MTEQSNIRPLRLRRWRRWSKSAVTAAYLVLILVLITFIAPSVAARATLAQVVIGMATFAISVAIGWLLTYESRRRRLSVDTFLCRWDEVERLLRGMMDAAPSVPMRLLIHRRFTSQRLLDSGDETWLLKMEQHATELLTKRDQLVHGRLQIPLLSRVIRQWISDTNNVEIALFGLPPRKSSV